MDFEKPIAELEGKVKELRHLATGSELDLQEEISKLESRAAKLLSQTYAKLNAWQKALVARHPDRPHFKDYVASLVENWTPLAGDRAVPKSTLEKLAGTKIMPTARGATPVTLGGYARRDDNRSAQLSR